MELTHGAVHAVANFRFELAFFLRLADDLVEGCLVEFERRSDECAISARVEGVDMPAFFQLQVKDEPVGIIPSFSDLISPGRRVLDDLCVRSCCA
jgi:hypothetical protein